MHNRNLSVQSIISPSSIDAIDAQYLLEIYIFHTIKDIAKMATWQFIDSNQCPCM